MACESSTDLIGVATVGLGVGEQHAIAFANLPQCRLLWLFDRDEHRAEQVARQFGGVSVARTYDSILSDPLVGLVSIASYDDAHFAQVVAALAARKHVFVEKPLCRSLPELRSIKDAWSQSEGRHVVSNLVLRAAPLYRWLREAILSGELGDVYAFDGDYLYGRLEKLTQGWRRDVENYSVMQGGGVHLVDLMMWLTGQRPVTATAVANRFCTAGTAFRYHDFAAATFTFPSGLIGRITANFGCVHRHQHVLRVFGTKATFICDDAGGNFQKVVRNIHQFLEIRARRGVKLPLLRVSFLKLDVNQHELENFIDYWKPYADYFSIQEAHDFFETNPDVTPTVKFQVPREKPGFKCSKPTHRLWMRYNGNGQSCGYPAAWEAFTLGTFPKDSISSMWRHETQKMLRVIHGEGRYGDHPLCHECVLHTGVNEEA